MEAWRGPKAEDLTRLATKVNDVCVYVCMYVCMRDCILLIQTFHLSEQNVSGFEERCNFA